MCTHQVVEGLRVAEDVGVPLPCVCAGQPAPAGEAGVVQVGGAVADLEGKAATVDGSQLESEGGALAWCVGGCWGELLEGEAREGAASTLKAVAADACGATDHRAGGTGRDGGCGGGG